SDGRAQVPAHLYAIDAGQHEVEHDEVGRLHLSETQRLGAVGRLGHEVALELQVVRQHLAHARLVIHHQDAATSQNSRLIWLVRPCWLAHGCGFSCLWGLWPLRSAGPCTSCCPSSLPSRAPLRPHACSSVYVRYLTDLLRTGDTLGLALITCLRTYLESR